MHACNPRSEANLRINELKYHMFRVPYFILGLWVKTLSCSREKGKELLNSLVKRNRILGVFWRGFIGVSFGNGLYYAVIPQLGKLVCPMNAIGEISREIHFDDAYFRGFEIREEETVVDVGAHVGIFTLHASKRVRENGTLISIEPEPNNFGLLEWNIKLNELKNVIPVRRALSDRCGKTKLYISDGSEGHSLNKIWAEKWIGTEKWIEVDVTTMDELLEELSVRAVTFIKIDAEGAEMDILKGAIKVLQRSEDVRLSIASYHYPTECQEVKNFLENLGFNVSLSPSGLCYVYAER